MHTLFLSRFTRIVWLSWSPYSYLEVFFISNSSPARHLRSKILKALEKNGPRGPKRVDSGRVRSQQSSVSSFMASYFLPPSLNPQTIRHSLIQQAASGGT